ncbi:PHP domain-containing protein [Paenibacillus sp. FSL R10-2734]|uniref:PHP domain-containing protein n=1 Tax=Paenibacillus sp. FSL R10-2734 TaxID=2954691 RepID=UPI0030DDD820
MKVELHCHTRMSDGSLHFAELLELAVQEQIGHLAVTNHDTTQGIAEMDEMCRERGIEFIPGIEISGYDAERQRRIHILGYFIEQDHEAIDALCSPLLLRRHEGCRLATERLIEAGYNIRWEDVQNYAAGGTGVYKQHIMHALIDQGYTDRIYGDLYKKLFSRGQRGEQPGIAYIPTEYVDARDAVRTIIQAGGVPVLAHPGQYQSFEAVDELVEAGLQGIEVWHPLHGEEDERQARELALNYNLIMTGGTDFHGFYGESPVTLGSKSPDAVVVGALKERKALLLWG